MAKHIVSNTSVNNNASTLISAEPDFKATPAVHMLRGAADRLFDAAWNARKPPTPRQLRAHARRLNALANRFEAPARSRR